MSGSGAHAAWMPTTSDGRRTAAWLIEKPTNSAPFALAVAPILIVLAVNLIISIFVPSRRDTGLF